MTLCISQAIFPFVVEALRTDILRPAIESIAHQTTTHVCPLSVICVCAHP